MYFSGMYLVYTKPYFPYSKLLLHVYEGHDWVFAYRWPNKFSKHCKYLLHCSVSLHNICPSNTDGGVIKTWAKKQRWRGLTWKTRWKGKHVYHWCALNISAPLHHYLSQLFLFDDNWAIKPSVCRLPWLLSFLMSDKRSNKLMPLS